MDETDRRPPEPCAPASYESDAVPAVGVVGALGATVAVLLLAGLALWAMLQAFRATGNPAEHGPPPQPAAAVEPRLQTTPAADLAALRAREDRALHASGVDPATGAMRIPIEQAMALTVKRAQRKTGALP